MAKIGFKTNVVSFDFGDADLLHSFFSTTCILLESGTWGSRFPCLMKELYWQEDGVPFIHLSSLWKELKIVQSELSDYPSERLVWDWEQPNLSIPDNQAGLRLETTLDKTYLADKGKTIFELLFGIKEYSDAFQSGVRIVITDLTANGVKSMFRIPKEPTA